MDIAVNVVLLDTLCNVVDVAVLVGHDAQSLVNVKVLSAFKLHATVYRFAVPAIAAGGTAPVQSPRASRMVIFNIGCLSNKLRHGLTDVIPESMVAMSAMSLCPFMATGGCGFETAASARRTVLDYLWESQS